MRPRIVLFVALDRSTAALIPAITQIGDVVAIVAHGSARHVRQKMNARKFAAPNWSFAATLSAAGQAPDLIIGETPRDPAALSDAVAAARPDLILSLLYPRQIPADVLAHARRGALNIHPAKLPGLAGPQPVQWLVAHDEWSRLGEVTLHEMDEGLDTGPVLAHGAMSARAFASPDLYKTAFAGVASALITEVVPGWMQGDVTGQPQPKGGAGHWAASLDGPVPVGPDWTLARLQRSYGFLGKRPGLGLALDGGLVRLPGPPQSIGDPTGKPPQQNGGRVEFDLRDARVSCRRAGWLGTQIAQSRKRRNWARHDPPQPQAITYPASSDPSSAAQTPVAAKAGSEPSETP